MFDNLGLSPQQQAIAEKIAAAGFAAGMTEAGVAAMVTAALHESSLNPTLSHPDAPPGSAQQFNSNGLFQMNRDRWDNLVEYAAQNGLDPWSADAQIGYQIHEMTNPPKPGISNYQKIAEPLFTSNDPAAASRAMSRIEGHAVLRDAQGLTEADRRAQTASGVYKDDYGNLVSAKYEIQGPPASAEAAKAPGIGLQSASMGGLIGPITSAQADPIPGNPDDPISQSSFFGQIGNAALKQTGQPFGAINMGTPAGFNRPGISYGYVGNPVTPSLFNDELSPQISAYAPVDVPPTAPAAPVPQPSAQLPGIGGMPPAGTFGSIPLGNYSMASVPAPAPQPSANVSISALAGPVPSLSLSGQASYPAPSPSAAVPPRDDMTTPPPGYSPVDVPTPPSLPSPEEARASLAGLNFTQGPAASTPAAFGTNYAPNDTATQAAKPAERFWSERLPGEGELNPVTSVEYAPKAGPVSIDGAPLAELNPAVGGFGAMPAGPPSVSMVTPNITTAAPPSSYGPVTPVAPNEEAMQLPAASQELPAPAAPLTLNELPAPAAPAFGSVA
ncbi:MAG: Phage tail lysozyme, partial [Pseudomonadota bacterium]